jgi:hypothetical protein
LRKSSLGPLAASSERVAASARQLAQLGPNRELAAMTTPEASDDADAPNRVGVRLVR